MRFTTCIPDTKKRSWRPWPSQWKARWRDSMSTIPTTRHGKHHWILFFGSQKSGIIMNNLDDQFWMIPSTSIILWPFLKIASSACRPRASKHKEISHRFVRGVNPRRSATGNFDVDHQGWTLIWINYNDLTATSLESWLISKGNHTQMALIQISEIL